MFNTHPWHKNNNDKLVNLYNLFTADIIPCLSVYRGTHKCSGESCQLAHINDSYNKSILYANKFTPTVIFNSKEKFKEWNHNEYLKLYYSSNKNTDFD
jgi:hypothetical protein